MYFFHNLSNQANWQIAYDTHSDYNIVHNSLGDFLTFKSQFYMPKGPKEFLRTYKTNINKPQNKIKPTKTSLWAWFKFWECLQRVSKKPKVCNPTKPVVTPWQIITCWRALQRAIHDQLSATCWERLLQVFGSVYLCLRRVRVGFAVGA